MVPEYDGPLEEVTLERVFEVAPSVLFDAWTVPDVASRWLFAPSGGGSVCELDVRVGGAYRITRTEDGQEYVAVGEYVTVDRPSRLAFTFGMPQFSPEFATVTVEIEPEGGGSRLRVTQDSLQPDFKQPILDGWSMMFGMLESALAE